MLKVELSNPSPEPCLPATLAALSRNASVISTSSSSDSGLSPLSRTPLTRPVRNFSSPRSSSPQTSSPRALKPPSYLTKELGHSSYSQPPLESDGKVRSKSRPRQTAVTVSDFQFGATLGEGSYSTVMKGTYLRTGQQYAIKVLDKNHLVRKQKMETAIAEKNALVTLGAGHPGLIRLYYTFQDEWSLYFVIDLAPNGEMQSLISRLGSLSTRCAQYYAAQIVDAMGYMHSRGVIHRDLKPENLLLDEAFRIKITDFGTGKILEPGVERARTFVGTAQYVSPELLESNETSKSSDFWALGCIIYQMIAGTFAFQGRSDYLTWQKIKSLEYTFPDGFDPEAKDLVEKILVRDPSKRLGVGLPGSDNDMHALRSHPYFASVSWETLWTDPAPPLEPGLVKREHHPASSLAHNWEDVGAEWDQLVVGDRHSGDGLDWASDGEGAEFQIAKQSGYALLLNSEDVGPLGEIRRHLTMERRSQSPGQGSATMTEEGFEVATGSITVRTAAPAPPSTGSPSSSSGGSTVENPNTQLEASERSSPDITAGFPDSQIDQGRGRNQEPSPVQGNGHVNDVNFSSQVDLWEGETVVFSSAVEAQSLRRRASRLLPIPVPPVKPKRRQLILTTQRLICLKQRQKGACGFSIKSELLLRTLDKIKEKEARAVIASVEPKAETEFVVLSSTKTYSYVTQNSSLATTWVHNIRKVLVSNEPQSKART